MPLRRGPAVIAKLVRVQISCSVSLLERRRTFVSTGVRHARTRTKSGSGAVEIQLASGIAFRRPNTGRHGCDTRGTPRIRVRPGSRTRGERRGAGGTAFSFAFGPIAFVFGLASHDSRHDRATSATAEAARTPRDFDCGFYRRNDRSGQPARAPRHTTARLVRNFPQ